jgi:type IV secretory pathway VirJ component
MKILLHIFFLFLLAHGQAQEKLPLLSLPASASDKPLIMYISGDGGLNDFTTTLTGALNKKGYPVQVINARAYFWKKKTPQEAAADISIFLATHSATHLLCIGYSFGADVWPFIISNMPPAIKAKIIGLVLIAPAASTDFEIHLTEMMGFNKEHPFKVVDGLNALSIPKTLAIIDATDTEFEVSKIHQPGFKLIKLTGGHHFDNNAPLLSSIISENF